MISCLWILLMNAMRMPSIADMFSLKQIFSGKAPTLLSVEIACIIRTT